MTILVTGGTGRTGGAVAHRLHESNVPFLILTRSGNVPSPYANHACRFDFLDPTTFENPFSTAKDTVKAIYIVVPLTLSDDIATPVIEFIDFAARKGVKRFVLLSSNTYEPPTRICGAVHQHLMDHKGDIEYAIVRPTWFMDSFSGIQVPTIRGQGTISSASGDGLARWISTDDVGAAAFRALTDPSLKNSDHILLGPELLSYDDIANILTSVTGKQITHTRLTLSDYKANLEAVGITGYRGQLLVELQDEMARDMENKPDNGEVEKLTGKKPMTFREWAEKHREVWI